MEDLSNTEASQIPAEHKASADEARKKMRAIVQLVDGVRAKTANELDLMQILLEDSFALSQLVQSTGHTPFTLRLIVRLMFSDCEAFLWVMKQLTLQTHEVEQFEPPLTPAERDLLRDKTSKINSNGEVEEEAAKISLRTNVLFFGKILARRKGVDFALTTGEIGWEMFNKAIKIRDRLTHPKYAKDMDVSREELMVVRDGMAWFHQNFDRYDKLRDDMKLPGIIERNKALADDARASGVPENEVRSFIEYLDPSFAFDECSAIHNDTVSTAQRAGEQSKDG